MLWYWAPEPAPVAERVVAGAREVGVRDLAGAGGASQLAHGLDDLQGGAAPADVAVAEQATVGVEGMTAVDADARLCQIVGPLPFGAQAQHLELAHHLVGVDVVELEHVHILGAQLG